jgi:uncharacterized OB-fold protein
MPPTRVSAAPGWFSLDEAEPHLLGTRCITCGSVFFPRESFFCRNPRCEGTTFEDVPLSRRGRLWSYTDNRYPPPPPYPAGEPFVPYAVAAVELEREKMVVLGQVASGIGCDRLEVGMEMELVLEPLHADADHEYLIWKWRPA